MGGEGGEPEVGVGRQALKMRGCGGSSGAAVSAAAAAAAASSSSITHAAAAAAANSSFCCFCHVVVGREKGLRGMSLGGGTTGGADKNRTEKDCGKEKS